MIKDSLPKINLLQNYFQYLTEYNSINNYSLVKTSSHENLSVLTQGNHLPGCVMGCVSALNHGSSVLCVSALNHALKVYVTGPKREMCTVKCKVCYL